MSQEDEELGLDLARGQFASAQPVAQERGFAGTALGGSSSRPLLEEEGVKPLAENAGGGAEGMGVDDAPFAAAAAKSEVAGWSCTCCTLLNADTVTKCAACKAPRQRVSHVSL